MPLTGWDSPCALGSFRPSSLEEPDPPPRRAEQIALRVDEDAAV
jgi:hypothetical protein